MTKERAYLQRRYTDLDTRCKEIEHMRDTGQITAETWVFYRKYYGLITASRQRVKDKLHGLGVPDRQIAAGLPQPGQMRLPF